MKKTTHSASTGAIKADLVVDVAGSCDIEDPLRIEATLFPPPPYRLTREPAVIFALPGYSRGYYNMHFDDHSGYFQAEHQIAWVPVGFSATVAGDECASGKEKRPISVGLPATGLIHPTTCAATTSARSDVGPPRLPEANLTQSIVAMLRVVIVLLVILPLFRLMTWAVRDTAIKIGLPLYGLLDA
jgi:hypothetical protein